MSPSFDRRRFLHVSAATALGMHAFAAGADAPGLVVGQAEGARVGREILADGGNAVDAAVSAALVAGVVALRSCGIGGYGGHMVVARPSGPVTAIDFNSAAPAAARPDMYALDEKGAVQGQVNTFGWLAVGVPGTLAGMQFALDRFGTRPLARLLPPAIRLARAGFPITRPDAEAIKTAASRLKADAGSAKLLLPGGQPPAAGATFHNPDLAALLERLAEAGSVRPFYEGPIADRLAAAFKANGGLVTAADLAAYRAREVAPLSLDWRDHRVVTAPLTAGGLSVLQALATLRSLAWETWAPEDVKTTHARVEALRVAWHDRLALLGDPEKGSVPVERLLSREHADRSAARVRKAVEAGTSVPGAGGERPDGGTVHLSVVDARGMMVALTLTHGGSFGAQVTADGLGLVLGHGLSRFDPRPGHPNSPGPGKRPLHNMCPTVVLKDNRPVAVLGATGGRRIPNTLFDVLLGLVGQGRSLEEAVKAPRMHTEGDGNLALEASWPEAHREYLQKVGYKVARGGGASLNGIVVDPKTGKPFSAAR